MGLLGKPQGVFKLDESDKYVGSFISKDDVKTILDVCDSGKELLDDNIDYDDVGQKLGLLRKESLVFLKKEIG